jgi:hypothetical protein
MIPCHSVCVNSGSIVISFDIFREMNLRKNHYQPDPSFVFRREIILFGSVLHVVHVPADFVNILLTVQ